MISKLLNGSFTPNFKSIGGALYVKQRQQLSLQQKNNANTLSETSGLLKSEVDMLRETWEAFKTEDMVVHFI